MTTIRSDAISGLIIDSDTSGNITFVTGESNVAMSISSGIVDLSSSRFVVPIGNTATRANVLGALRFNNESNIFEAYNGSDWTNVLSPPSESSESSGYSVGNPYGLHIKDPQKNIYRLYTYDSSITSTDTGTISGIAFNEDGTRMFLLNQGNDKILEFYIAEGWNVANAKYSGNVVTLSGAGDPHDLVIKPDGTKLYVASRASPAGIVEYMMSTPWDISTISVSNTFVSSAQETAPYSVHIGDNGNVFYLYGQTTDTVYEYRMSTAWDLSTTSYSGNSYSLTGDPPAGEGTPYNVFLSEDGTYMYTHGIVGDFLKLHTLSTPWNLSTATFTKDLIDFSGYPTSPFTIKPADNGRRIYVCDITNDTIIGYTANNPWGDFGLSCKSVLSEDGTPFGIYIKPDGTKLYMAGTATDKIFEYDIAVPYDIGTATYTGNNISFAANSSLDDGFTMSSDGNHFFLSDIYNAVKWTMTTPWDITTAAFAEHRNVLSDFGRYYKIEISGDGTRSYGVTTSTVYESDVITQLTHPSYNIANATIEYAFMISDIFGYPHPITTLRFNEDGTKLYLLCSATNITGSIEEYTVNDPYDLYSIDSNSSKRLTFARVYGDSGSSTITDLHVLNGNIYVLSSTTDAIQQIRIT
jgi:hypothetical protein